MGKGSPHGRLALARAYARLAGTYWLGTYVQARREMRNWHQRANSIPDPALRALAIDAQSTENSNVEGAAAFAVLAPRRLRPRVLRAQVAFATLSDYLDTLAEQPSTDRLANGFQLNLALMAALDSNVRDIDFYAHSRHRDDGGYLDALVQCCRAQLVGLPSLSAISEASLTLAEHNVCYQSLNQPERHGGHRLLAEWARTVRPPRSRLHWWEIAAAADSTLGTLALISLAAHENIQASEVESVISAYWPNVEAISALLDSAVDEAEDLAAGQKSLLHYYENGDDAAHRIAAINAKALRDVSLLPDGAMHAAIFLGMVGSYLARLQTGTMGDAISVAVREPLGYLIGPTVMMFQVRRKVGAVISFPSDRFGSFRSTFCAATPKLSRKGTTA